MPPDNERENVGANLPNVVGFDDFSTPASPLRCDRRRGRNNNLEIGYGSRDSALAAGCSYSDNPAAGDVQPSLSTGRRTADAARRRRSQCAGDRAAGALRVKMNKK